MVQVDHCLCQWFDQLWFRLVVQIRLSQVWFISIPFEVIICLYKPSNYGKKKLFSFNMIFMPIVSFLKISFFGKFVAINAYLAHQNFLSGPF